MLTTISIEVIHTDTNYGHKDKWYTSSHDTGTLRDIISTKYWTPNQFKKLFFSRQ